MAKEVLAAPEEKLREVIAVIRAGMKPIIRPLIVSQETIDNLTRWCDEEERYLEELKGGDTEQVSQSEIGSHSDIKGA